MLRRLYDWTLSLGSSRHAVWALAAVSFIESSIFPIPPDALLIPMILADRSRAWRLAAICTVASVIGGFLGYAIGYFAFDAIGEPLLRFYGITEQYQRLEELYAHYGAWLIIIKGATPIPFKLVTIASGAFHFPLLTFAISAVISRGIRFFLIAGLLWRYGESIRDFIERRLGLVFSLAVAAVLGGFLIVGVLR
ncbi:MAG: YqaA family protein [Amaricoccus sp.]|uniref:YqaA family protein n=1 Tax=Amaricoccus sp. TaxID=1872485 RepID=UPI0039E6C738